MALMVPPANEKKRVKVYELKNNDWFDRGTGFCSGRPTNVSSFTHLSWLIAELLTRGSACWSDTNNTDICAQEESKILV